MKAGLSKNCGRTCGIMSCSSAAIRRPVPLLEVAQHRKVVAAPVFAGQQQRVAGRCLGKQAAPEQAIGRRGDLPDGALDEAAHGLFDSLSD